MARNLRTGQKAFLLAQGYMPAQDIHILKNPADPTLSPWYKLPSGDRLRTPDWIFKKTQLRYFAQQKGGTTQSTRPAGRRD